MTSTLLKITLQPQSPFITPLASDTLFGQLCWAIRHTFGNARLNQLLEGYTHNQPFVVLSNTLPKGFIPRPTLPLLMLGYDLIDSNNRKDTKNKVWIALDESFLLLQQELSTWHKHSKGLGEMIEVLIDEKTKTASNSAWQTIVTQPHNSLNRLTNTTGSENGFSPFSRDATYYHSQAQYDLYAVIDESRFSTDELMTTLNYIGAFGYGKEASSGAGKFTVSNPQNITLKAHTQANAYLTLGNCAPQGQQWFSERCYYNTTVRFGRHGAEAVYMGSPFKNPVLMAVAGAVLTPTNFANTLFVGQGLTGLSKTISHTVQQGYAPVLPIYLDK